MIITNLFSGLVEKGLGFARRAVLRYRTLSLLAVGLFAIYTTYHYFDRDGASLIQAGVSALQVFWAIALAVVATKMVYDYKEADTQTHMKSALEEKNVGSGLVVLAKALVIIFFSFLFSKVTMAADQFPTNFQKIEPTIKAEQMRWWSDHPQPSTLRALAEQESCVSLKSPKCMNPKARLKTSREEGAGIGQITRAWRKDGSLRFDMLATMRQEHKDALGQMTWDNIYDRPDLQIRSLILLNKDAYRPFRSLGVNGLDFADSAYNGGPGDVIKSRRACAAAKGCNPNVWFGNVERHLVKSKTPMYGSRSAFSINLEHVRNVRLIRRPKYARYLGETI
jgi:hypothetical protein